MLELLPHLIGTLNGILTALLVCGLVAIRQGRRKRHRRIMLTAILLGLLFLVLYVVQYSLVGHRRFPGDDWVRTLFLAILASHTLLAIAVVPLILRTAHLALRARFETHRRIARVALPIWLYVGITGVVIYWMNHHLRPPG